MSERRSGTTGRKEDIVERKSRVLFIRNIPYATKEEDVKGLFETIGELKKFYAKISDRGIAFVTFYDIRDAEKAHGELNGHKFGEREIQVHYSLPKDSELNLRETLENHANLYVLMKDTDTFPSNEEYAEYFGQYGEVAEVRQMESKKNVKFVEFYDSRAAKQAIEKANYQEWKGGVLEVKYASFSKIDLDRIEKTKQQLEGLRKHNRDGGRDYERDRRDDRGYSSYGYDRHDGYSRSDRDGPRYPPHYPPQYMGGYPPNYPQQIPPPYMTNYPPQYYMPPPGYQAPPPQGPQGTQGQPQPPMQQPPQNQPRKDAPPAPQQQQPYQNQYQPNQYYQPSPQHPQQQGNQTYIPPQNNQQVPNRPQGQVQQPQTQQPPTQPNRQPYEYGSPSHTQRYEPNASSPQRQSNQMYSQQNPYH